MIDLDKQRASTRRRVAALAARKRVAAGRPAEPMSRAEASAIARAAYSAQRAAKKAAQDRAA